MNDYNSQAVDPMTGMPIGMQQGDPSLVKPNQMQPNAINPRLFSNPAAINNLNPGSVYNQGKPQMPPTGVQTNITPVLGTENQ